MPALVTRGTASVGLPKATFIRKTTLAFTVAGPILGVLLLL
jgi:hypothetical protein